ncbi:LOW QUALITY PROTEIN: olfactory receptor 5V1-like [Leptodactylus fuscus]
METYNNTSPSVFILRAISNVQYVRVTCFIVLLVIYVFAVSGNLLLIVVVRINPSLQTPMYFFLSNLSVIDICFTSTIVPTVLANALSKDTSISLVECAAQMYVSAALGSTECLILAIMAYDRFAAICRPLHYNTIMSKKLCTVLAAGSWSLCCTSSAFHVGFTFQLPYCRSHHVNHFFCEMPPFFRLSCKEPFFNEIAMYISAGVLAMGSFFLTLISYIYIISTILKIRSSEGRQKAFATCGSHVAVVLIYGTIMFTHMRPRSSQSSEADKVLSILYTAVTPMLNPIIYSIRNKDIKGAIRTKLIKQSINH